MKSVAADLVVTKAELQFREYDRTRVWAMEGEGTPGAQIQFKVPGFIWHDLLKVSTDGTWHTSTYISKYGQGATTKELTFRQMLEGGTWSAVKTAEVTVAAPVISAPDTSDTPRPEISGRGVPGAEVTLRIGDTDFGSATVDDHGNWSVVPDEDLPAGTSTLTAVEVLFGMTSPATRKPITLPGAERRVSARDLSEVVLADVTGDGKGDILAKPEDSAGLYLFQGRGDGTFEHGTEVFDGWVYAQTVAGDFDGDGTADLVATDGDGTLHLWRGKGDGTFGERQKLTGWTGKEQTTAGDIDGDGITDLVALDTKDHRLKLWKGTKGGSGNPFARPQVLTRWEGFRQSSLGDLDGKGLAHLVAATTDPRTGKTSLRLRKSKGAPRQTARSPQKRLLLPQTVHGSLTGPALRRLGG
ncbi:FG-GAP-like repeat-containing protein [Streptomyces bambusae]|uniref:VCBS repeat-containing protein n=1 Tax=Streptomyces bambusae TaxID=1550616 RepID=UPI001CFF8142|nr:VCBS repeat-containing protein [Streptomyces bambusae]MCB5169459.1 FG-GAP-like repeat-containing protein [Streptomyces bambusae]